MSITIEQLSKNIQEARRQELAHRSSADACAGAAQAYEQLLSQLVKAKREEATAGSPAVPSNPGDAGKYPESVDKPTKKSGKKAGK